MRTLCLIALLLITTSCAGRRFEKDLAQQNPLAQIRDSEADGHWCVAHRGRLHGNAENSLAGLREAMAAGVPFLEVDVRRSTDGILFLFHDPRISRESVENVGEFSNVRVEELPYATLATLRPLGAHNESIPRFADALKLAVRFDKILELDVKSEREDVLTQIVDELRREGAVKNVVVQCRKAASARLLRSLEPEIGVIIRLKSAADLTEALTVDPDGVELERWYSRAAVQQAHAANVRVLFNISNSPVDTNLWKRILSLAGVDMIMTDYADKACSSMW